MKALRVHAPSGRSWDSSASLPWHRHHLHPPHPWTAHRAKQLASLLRTWHCQAIGKTDGTKRRAHSNRENTSMKLQYELFFRDWSARSRMARTGPSLRVYRFPFCILSLNGKRRRPAPSIPQPHSILTSWSMLKHAKATVWRNMLKRIKTWGSLLRFWWNCSHLWSA